MCFKDNGIHYPKTYCLVVEVYLSLICHGKNLNFFIFSYHVLIINDSLSEKKKSNAWNAYLTKELHEYCSKISFNIKQTRLGYCFILGKTKIPCKHALEALAQVTRTMFPFYLFPCGHVGKGSTTSMRVECEKVWNTYQVIRWITLNI